MRPQVYHSQVAIQRPAVPSAVRARGGHLRSPGLLDLQRCSHHQHHAHISRGYPTSRIPHLCVIVPILTMFSADVVTIATKTAGAVVNGVV